MVQEHQQIENELVVLESDDVSHIPLATAAAKRKEISKDIYTLAKLCQCNCQCDFL